jgi:hypothetical protein
MILEKEFLFIIGSPRSGTTWLQAMIGAHPRVCTTVELTLYTKYTAPWLKAWKGEFAINDRAAYQIGLPVLWTKGDFYGFLKTFLERVYACVLETKPEATHVLDKHPGYSEVVEDIHELLPNARFIHVIRDGRDVVLSMVAAHRSMGFGPGSIHDAALRWAKGIQGARRAQQYEERYLEVRYEDMLADGTSVLKDVFEFCGLHGTEDEVAGIVDAHRFATMKAKKLSPVKGIEAPDGAFREGRAGGWMKELRPLERYLLDRQVGGLLREYGYANDGWWYESEGQRLTLPLFAAVRRLAMRLRRAALVLAGRALFI